MDIVVIDNSREPVRLDFDNLSGIEYIKTRHNIGFGAAHNLAIKMSLERGAKYHLVINPDVRFSAAVLEELYQFMESNPDVGNVMPKVCYPDGSNQYLAKLLPRPGWLLVRLFHFLLPAGLVYRVNREYELHELDLEHPVQVPSLSGCFMFLRCDALKKAGLFDERFFLYFEDFDLIRRISWHYKVVYYPRLFITHDYARTSRKSLRAFVAHVSSAVKYFNKWGWFCDRQGDLINSRILSRTGKKSEYYLD